MPSLSLSSFILIFKDLARGVHVFTIQVKSVREQTEALSMRARETWSCECAERAVRVSSGALYFSKAVNNLKLQCRKGLYNKTQA